MALTRLLETFRINRKPSAKDAERGVSKEEAEGGGAGGQRVVVEKAENEASNAEAARYAAEIVVLFNTQNLEKAVDAGDKYFGKGSVEAILHNVAQVTERVRSMMAEIEQSYQSGQITEKDVSVYQRAMRQSFSSASDKLSGHSFKLTVSKDAVDGAVRFLGANLDILQATARERISLRNLLTEQDGTVPAEARINIPEGRSPAANSRFENGVEVVEAGDYIGERKIAEKDFRAANGEGVGPAAELNTRFQPQLRQKFAASAAGKRGALLEEVSNFEVVSPDGTKQQRARKVSYGANGQPSSIELTDPLGV